MYERESVDNLMEKEIEVEGTVVFDVNTISLFLIFLSLYSYTFRKLFEYATVQLFRGSLVHFLM